jgi:sodium-dependent dicarboxylate transporter 2/3/5
MAVTAFLSRWVSNTAYAAMMVPIALSVVDLAWRTRTGAGLKESGGILQDRIPARHFATGLLPCIAYAASSGGLVTLIGSPPDGIAVRYIQQTFGKVARETQETAGAPTRNKRRCNAWEVEV